MKNEKTNFYPPSPYSREAKGGGGSHQKKSRPEAVSEVGGDNYEKVEKAIDKYGFPKSNGQANLLKAIQYGQCLVNEELLREALKEL